jgi:ATP-dependent DNA helicase
VDDRLVQSAGKLHLLDRILPILKSKKHKVGFPISFDVESGLFDRVFQVLIFCQMTIMMDLLEDYLDLRHYKSERIDGTVPWKERQVVQSSHVLFRTSVSDYLTGANGPLQYRR